MSSPGDTPPTGGGPPIVAMDAHRGAPSWRLVTTLAMAGVIAGLLIVFVYRGTLPRIQAYKAEMLQLAIEEVLKAPQRFDTLYLYEGTLASGVPDGVDASNLERVYLGYDEDGQPVGYAIAAGEPGFQDVIQLIFGYDAARRQVLGMKVLESKETPGLGDKIEKDQAFVTQFDGAQPPLVGVKARGAPSTDPREIDMITGATISSRTVIRIINNAVERLMPALEAYASGGSP